MKESVLKRLEQEVAEHREYLVSGAFTAVQILDGAYEVTMKQFVFEAMEKLADEERLQQEVWNWLNCQENVLDYLYTLWMRYDVSFILELEDVLLDELNYDREVHNHE